jgi:hypothetical protein
MPSAVQQIPATVQSWHTSLTVCPLGGIWCTLDEIWCTLDE